MLHAFYLSATSSKALPNVLSTTRGALSALAQLLTLNQIDGLKLKSFDVFSHEGKILLWPKTNRMSHNIVTYIPSGHSTCNCSFYLQCRLPCLHGFACFEQFKAHNRSRASSLGHWHAKRLYSIEIKGRMRRKGRRKRPGRDHHRKHQSIDTATLDVSQDDM